MIRRELLRLLLATPLAGWIRPWVSAPPAGAGALEPNAAALYRKAFVWAAGLPSGDHEWLRNIATRPVDDPDFDRILQDAGPVLEAVREATAIPRCQWEHEILAVGDLNRDQLNIANLDLIRLACLSARRRAGANRFHEALDDAFAGLTLAHRLGTGGVLFARLLESAGEAVAFQTLGRILPDLDRAALDDLARRLDALPAPEPASAMIGPESRFIIDSARAKLMTMGAVIAEDDWAEFGYGPEAAATLKRLTDGDRAALIAHYEATGPAFAELARRLDLPRAQLRPALDALALAERSAHPVVAMLVDKALWHRFMVDQMRALRMMLRAGVTLVRFGAPAFLDVADPFGTGPFELQRVGKGFVIRSALRDEGRPEVSLALGEAAGSAP
jgi:hypothetical protein